MPRKKSTPRRNTLPTPSAASTGRSGRSGPRPTLSDAELRTLRRLRKIVDRLNEALCLLCDVRLRAAGTIAAWKAERGLPLVDPVREEEMFAAAADSAVPGGFSAADRCAVLSAVLRGTKAALKAASAGPKARGRGGVRGR